MKSYNRYRKMKWISVLYFLGLIESTTGLKISPSQDTLVKKLCDFSPKLLLISRVLVSATLSLATLQCAYAGETLKEYKNDRFHTTISYPSSWEEKAGLLSSERTIVAFVDPNDADTSVSLAFNPIPADFSRLNSFGGKENLKSYLLPSGEGVKSDTLNENIKGESYYLEYVTSAPDAPTRHISSIFALKPQDFVVGVTVQTKEDTFSSHKVDFDSIIKSFNLDLN